MQGRATPTTEGVTAEMLLDMRNGRRELVRGEVREMPPAGYEHGRVGSDLFGPLWAFVKAQALGVVVTAETGFILERNPDTVRAPDLAFVAGDRGRQLVKGFAPFAPDLAVEVVSPSDTYSDVEEKADFWLQHGTREVWVVDPATRSLQVRRSEGSVRRLAEQDVLDGGDILPGFTLPLREVFPVARQG